MSVGRHYLQFIADLKYYSLGLNVSTFKTGLFWVLSLTQAAQMP